MGLLGKGVLAIWNGIAPEAEDDFVAWHVREHISRTICDVVLSFGTGDGGTVEAGAAPVGRPALPDVSI